MERGDEVGQRSPMIMAAFGINAILKDKCESKAVYKSTVTNARTCHYNYVHAMKMAQHMGLLSEPASEKGRQEVEAWADLLISLGLI